MALLDGAPRGHRAIIATLAGAGLRVGEALALDWRGVDLATGILRVGEAKTAAGQYREVDLPGGLIEALSEWKATTTRGEPDDPAFTFRVYQKAAKRRDRLTGRYREAFDAALDWAEMGRIDAPAPAMERRPADEQADKPLAQAESRYPGR